MPFNKILEDKYVRLNCYKKIGEKNSLWVRLKPKKTKLQKHSHRVRAPSRATRHALRSIATILSRVSRHSYVIGPRTFTDDRALLTLAGDRGEYSQLTLRTRRYYGHPDNTDSS